MNLKINKKTIALLIIGAFAVLIVSALIFILTPRGKPLPKLETAELYSVVQDGDIILRLGDRFWSQLFKEVSENDKRYSHSGIIRKNEGVITVIHSEGDTGHGRDYVNEVAFEDFISIARAIGIYRIKDTIIESTGIDKSRISNTAMEYLGVPFDWGFDLSDKTRVYCTELLSWVLKRLSPELELNAVYAKEWGRDIIPLDAVSTSEYFTEVFYISSF